MPDPKSAPAAPTRPVLNVALIGYAFMGRAHSNAYQQVGRFFPDCPFEIRRKVLVGRTPGPLAEAAATWGWDETASDAKAVIARKDIDLIDIATPNDSHAELAQLALAAGKHVLCEKPLGMTVAETRTLAATAEKAKGKSGIWHNYRRCPAMTTAAHLIRDGKIGEVRHVRAAYLQDWLIDDMCPWLWRMDRARCGSGALGDLAAHLIDAVRFITGLEFGEVAGLEETFIRERRKPNIKTQAMARVDVDDAFVFIARMNNGALASVEASRCAAGRKNHHHIEINGTRGSLAWNFERMNELEFFSREGDPREQGFRTILCNNPAAHAYAGAYWPDGHVLGYEHTFTNTLYDFLQAIALKKEFRPDFRDGVAVQEVLESAQQASKRHTWVKVPRSQKFSGAAVPARPKPPA